MKYTLVPEDRPVLDVSLPDLALKTAAALLNLGLVRLSGVVTGIRNDAGIVTVTTGGPTGFWSDGEVRVRITTDAGIYDGEYGVQSNSPTEFVLADCPDRNPTSPGGTWETV